MAFELKNITQKVIDDDSSDADDEGMEHGAEFAKWMQFCQSEIEPIENTWNRRLEESKDSVTSESKKDDDDLDDDAERENTLEGMLEKISVRLKGQRNQTQDPKSKKDEELERAIKEAQQEE